MAQPTIHHLALRRAADAVTQSLDGELPAELAHAQRRWARSPGSASR